jgi:hypothetical protein
MCERRLRNNEKMGVLIIPDSDIFKRKNVDCRLAFENT